MQLSYSPRVTHILNCWLQTLTLCKEVGARLSQPILSYYVQYLSCEKKIFSFRKEKLISSHIAGGHCPWA